MLLTIIVFLLTLLVLVLSHEFGHFFSAKKFGIKILEFGFGLPPKILGKKIGETVYSLNLLPIGGFVKMLGEDEVEKDVLNDKRSFAAKPVWQRIIVVIGGVLMNLVLAVAIFTGVLFATNFKEQLPLLKPYNFIGVNQENQTSIFIGKVTPGSPADSAQMKTGDQVVAFNGQKLNSGQELIDLTKSLSGQPITLTLTDESQTQRNVTIIPRVNPPEGQGPLGVELASLSIANLTYPTLPQKIFSGFIHSYNIAVYSFSILGDLIKESWQTKNIEPVSGTLSGPVGITSISNAILHTSSPLIPYLNFIGLLSLNLAIINILPFPALDGGRLVFLLIEAVFKKRVKAEVERWIHTAGMAVLLALIILITFSDVRKLFM